MFSTRSALDRAANPLARALAVHRERGRTPLDLTVSNPTTAGLAADAQQLSAALAQPGAVVYEPAPFGLEPARAAIAATFAPGLEPSHVVLTASTSEAYGYAFKLLCDPGDEVLVPQPSYPLFDYLARFDAVRPVPYRLAYDGAWHVDLDSVRRAIGPRTRALLVVSPNNPTGSYLRRDELAALAELGLPIVSDEVFADYPLDAPDSRARSVLEADAPLVIALGGLSKSAGLPQLKLAWMALGGARPRVDEALARLELIADAYLSVGAPVQHALPRLLALGEQTRRAIRLRIRANLSALQTTLAGSAATLLRCEGGWYGVLQLPRTMSEEDWVLGLLEREELLVQPGWFYDFAAEPFVVVSLLTPESELQTGAERLVSFVAR